MLQTYKPSDQEIMHDARRCLQARKAGQGAMPDRITELGAFVGPAPLLFEKPRYGTPSYALAFRLGWITEGEETADRAAYEKRRKRSLQNSHRHSLYERPRYDPPRDSGAYVPELSARLEEDRNLTDGARRCARKLAELTYRSSREERALEITVSYLVEALGRCRRTVQRYLRLLEREGYIRADVVAGARSRLCIGLAVQLLGPLLAPHHREKWPQRARNPGATPESQNHRFTDTDRKKRRVIPRNEWTMRCMDGVFRALMKTIPTFEPVPAASG